MNKLSVLCAAMMIVATLSRGAATAAVSTEIYVAGQTPDRTEYRRARARELKVKFLDTLGQSLRNVEMFATLAGEKNRAFAREDPQGNRYFRVRDNDTLQLFVFGHTLEVPVAGMDSLVITLPVRRLDSVNYIDPVTVSARRPDMVDTGMGVIAAGSYAGPGGAVDMKYAGRYTNLLTFLRGRVAGLTINADGSALLRGPGTINGSSEPLVILDGTHFQGTLRDVSDILSMSDIQSVFVMKDGAWFGMRGANGAIIISTKKGGDY